MMEKKGYEKVINYPVYRPYHFKYRLSSTRAAADGATDTCR